MNNHFLGKHVTPPWANTFFYLIMGKFCPVLGNKFQGLVTSLPRKWLFVTAYPGWVKFYPTVLTVYKHFPIAQSIKLTKTK